MRFTTPILRHRAAASGPRLLLAVLAAVATLHAQTPQDDDGTLFFPPKIRFRSDDIPAQISRNETRFYSTAPVLPIVFFDEPGGFTIPERYVTFTSVSQTRDYTDTSIVANQYAAGFAGKYPELLNIIGYRMRQFPETTIQLVGGYSTEPGENRTVAITRAQVIAKYLTDIWDIGSDRIGFLPPQVMCDSGDHSMRQEEARRVMIMTRSWQLLRPLRYAAVRKAMTPLFLELIIDPELPPGMVDKIVLVAKRDRGGRICEAVVNGTPEVSIYSISAMWMPSVEDESANLNFSSVSIQAFVQSTDGTVRESNRLTGIVHDNLVEGDEAQQPVRSVTVPFFGWRDSTLTDLQKLLMADFFQNLETDRSGELYIEVRGGVEETEDPFMNEGAAEMIRRRQRWQSLLKSTQQPQFQPDRIVIFSQPDGSTESVKADSYISGAVYSPPPVTDDRISDNVEAASRAEAARKREFKALAAARIEAVKSYIDETASFSPTMMDELLDKKNTTFAETPVAALPEERWFARSATIYVISSEFVPQSMRDKRNEANSESNVSGDRR